MFSGNILIIMTVCLYKPLRKRSNVFVVSLASWDLFQNLLVKSIYVYTYFTLEWQLGAKVCLYALFASNLAILESIIHVSAIAFHRYIILVHPTCVQRFQFSKTILLLLFLMYLLPACIVILPSIPRLAGKPLEEQVIFNHRIMFCSFVKHSEFRLGGVLKKVIFLGIAALFLLYCYIRIYLVVKQSGQSVHNSSGVFSPTRLRREWTLLKTIMVIFMSFVLSYLPLSILYGVDTDRNFPYWLYFLAVLALWSSSSVNWLIYGLMNDQYWKGYRYLLCGTTLHNLTVTTTNRTIGRRENSSLRMSVRNEGHRGSYHTCIATGCRITHYDAEM